MRFTGLLAGYIAVVMLVHIMASSYIVPSGLLVLLYDWFNKHIGIFDITGIINHMTSSSIASTFHYPHH